MRRSRLWDLGRETMLVYPEVVKTDSRGDEMKVPSDVPVEVRVTTKESRSNIAELPGNVHARILEVFARSAPVGPWAKVYYDGEYWDVTVPPRTIAGMSKSTSGVTFSIRSRNKTGE